VDEEAAS